MKFFLLLLLFSALHADELTVDPPKPWEAPCTPCRAPMLSPPIDAVVVD